MRVPDHMPVTVQLGEQRYAVRDLSAGGLSFRTDDLDVRGLQPYALDLGQPPRIRGKLKVLGKDERGCCRATFVDLNDQDRDSIHHYVLEVQKDEIRSTREQRVIDDADL